MILELHILQNFAPSNLNRDDTGSPKSCEFGGYRRARISSQCLKRAIREEFRASGLVDPEHRAERTKRIVKVITERLADRGRTPEEARAVVEQALGSIGLKTAPDANAVYKETIAGAEVEFRKTEYLLFVGPNEVAALTDFCETNWEPLQAIAAASGEGGRGGAKRAARDAAKDALSKRVVDRLRDALNGGKAADLALFGRMLADIPERNIDAASQVAHAVSTHAVGLEFDYYTAVDDLKPEDNAGADMIGTIEFNSACYYRYANVDLGQLSTNLGEDRELVAETVRAFLLASRDAEPSGKQNSFAARNKPSFVFAVVRDRGSWSLANAFAKPVRATGRDDDLVALSVGALAGHWRELVEMYEAPEGLTAVACGLGDLANVDFGDAVRGPAASYRELVEVVLDAIAAKPGAA